MSRRLGRWRENNDLSLYSIANNAEDLGHPKAKPAVFPIFRFFQENKTEVLEMDCDGNEFEMFESMRVYIERSGRPYNYLSSVSHLNNKREDYLNDEEKDTKSAQILKQEETKQVD